MASERKLLVLKAAGFGVYGHWERAQLKGTNILVNFIRGELCKSMKNKDRWFKIGEKGSFLASTALMRAMSGLMERWS